MSAAGAARAAAVLFAVALAGAACTGPPASSDVPARPMRLADFAKSDVDQVAEIHLARTRDHLAELMRKLYRRNPSAWRDADRPSAEFMVQRVLRPQRVPDFLELGGRRDIDAVRLAFEPGYGGDRVLALVAGLASMVDKAYANKREFYLLDELDPQKLYNCARNIETAAWLLRSRTGSDERPLILSHSLHDEALNLSFERLFGMLVSLQDTLALIVAERSNRTIRTVVHRAVGAVFLPI